MSIVHINQIRTRLEAIYKDKIDLSDVSTRPPDEQKNQFLTRALAAYALEIEAEIPPDEASKALTDGFDDNGLDAIYISPRDRRIFIVQSKWIHNGSGQPDLGAISKFVKGAEDLLGQRFEMFNGKIKNRKSEIMIALNDPDWKLTGVIAYTGTEKLAIHASDALLQLQRSINDTTEYLEITTLTQKELYAALVSKLSGKPITLEIGLRSWGKIEKPFAAYYGQVNVLEVGKWWLDYRTGLFAGNLRSVLGDTEVNKEIRETLDSQPELFWYFNNGITILAHSIKRALAHAGTNEYGTFYCEGISIVNGAQTVSTIGKYLDSSTKKLSETFLPIRLISLESAFEGFGDSVTKTNNRQNRVEVRDFVSLDVEQLRIKTELALEKIEYQVVRSDSFKASPASFDLVESTTSLACALGEADMAVQLKREPGKLWEDVKKSPYTRLFNEKVSGPYVWQCVLVQRSIDDRLDIASKSEPTGRNQSILIWGNRIIASIVFRLLDFQQLSKKAGFNFLNLIADHDFNTIVDSTAEELISHVASDYPGSYIAMLFRNPTKSKDLYAKTSVSVSLKMGDVLERIKQV